MEIQQIYPKSHGSKGLTQLKKVDTNKDSVNTSIGEAMDIEAKSYQIMSQSQNVTVPKKTQFICKKRQKQTLPILKHKQVLETLRKITKNIKNQLQTYKIQDKKVSNNPQKSLLESQIQPQINLTKITCKEAQITATNNNFAFNQKNLSQEKINNKDILVQSFKCTLQKIDKVKQSEIDPNNNEIIPHVMQSLMLYSKRKKMIQKFPVYEDRVLTGNKQLRNLTIQRIADNDIESDDQQIQMGVGFMYYQLFSSCHKQTQRKKQQNMNKTSYMKNSHTKANQNQVPLSKLKQKLIFQ